MKDAFGTGLRDEPPATITKVQRDDEERINLEAWLQSVWSYLAEHLTEAWPSHSVYERDYDNQFRVMFDSEQPHAPWCIVWTQPPRGGHVVATDWQDSSYSAVSSEDAAERILAAMASLEANSVYQTFGPPAREQ